MPELPEVETVRRELRERILGKTIEKVFVNAPRLLRGISRESFSAQVPGSSITDVKRAGKMLILELSGGKAITVHLKMTGQLVYPGNGSASRIRFLLSGGEYLDFNDRRLFAEIGLSGDWRNIAFVKSLGPEPFDITPARFHEMLSGRKIKIKPLLLDQTFVAGIGNLYAAEALFRAGIHPARQAGSLSPEESAKLLKAITATLKEAIKHKGSSMDQYVRPSGERGDYVKFHKVYGREGLACGGCGGKIKRIALGGRGTYFCPACQK